LPAAKKTYPELAQLDFSTLESAVRIMDAEGLTDEAITAVFDLMGEIQREHRIMFSGETVFAHLKVLRPPEGSPYLYFTVPLNIGVAEVHTMNRKLASLLVERLPYGTYPSGMTSSFTKAQASVLRAAA
jgi:hypothetical protein